MGKYTICRACKPLYDRDIHDLSEDKRKLLNTILLIKRIIVNERLSSDDTIGQISRIVDGYNF